ncbi:hypothetical protein W822_06135 [Advenella kashmirensis W13003]|uniref:Uncharacterized protein n=1 Tax=Advenella kashmirensis W13003 TaxID=1424334 RepID=V8QUI7_9BURK|nr:hypothetical protein W822_06135 [Advenella kashmirensis W13003]
MTVKAIVSAMWPVARKKTRLPYWRCTYVAQNFVLLVCRILLAKHIGNSVHF